MEEIMHVNVIDVYDLATDIAKEVEKIIDIHGADVLKTLMPRVICALEHLEKFANNHESAATQIEDLRATVAQLESEKLCKIENRQKYEKELEEIEDRLQEQSNELVSMVTRLQDENRRLASSLAQSQGSDTPNGSAVEDDSKLLNKLRDMVEKQHEQLRKHEREINEKTTSIDSLTTQVGKLTEMNTELRRRHRLSTTQMRSLIDERADLQAMLQEEQRMSANLRQRLGLAEKENQDLSLSSNESIDLSNKLVYDRDDPSRPRFTIEELKEILYERNELKAKVSDLEDELAIYRPKPLNRQDSHIVCPPLDVGFEKSTSWPQKINEDLPVQGPLPCDPEDAPWRKKDTVSGIRKLMNIVYRNTVKPEIVLGIDPNK